MKMESLKISQALFNFLNYVDNDTCLAPDEVQDFLMCLSSPSPVCSYIHVNESVKTVIDEIISGVNIKERPLSWKIVSEEIPILEKLFSNCSLKNTPQPLIDVIHELWSKAELTFSTTDDQVQSVDDSLNVLDEELAFFPNLPKIRNRGCFAADVSKSKKDAGSCNKKYTGHPTLLPGIFTIYCQHGICYGFQLMQQHESPNIPFSIFRTRFITAPKIIIYDNACSLHNYVLNRDPTFFKNTIFLVDRLHWKNHTGCGSGYSLSKYTRLEYINSQVNEQANAGLQRIKDQLSYMTAEHFITHCSFFLWNKNRLKADQLLE